VIAPRLAWPRSFFGAALGLLFAASCSTDRPASSCDVGLDGSSPGVSLILIVNDTMRRDRVGVYGGAAKTPVFDRFARDNLLFERAFTQAPWTKPSIATLFTSLYPSQHGLASHPELRTIQEIEDASQPLPAVDVLDESYVTLAEVLRDAGYRTAAFVSNPWMNAEFGFAQGFDVYRDDLEEGWDVPGERISHAGLEWIGRLTPGEPFFLYLHYIDSHRPYGTLDDSLIDDLETLGADPLRSGSSSKTFYDSLVDHPQQEFSAEGRKRLSSMEPRMALIDEAYDRGIEEFDRALEIFLDGFSGHPDHDRTAVVITSDHGEALFERGYGNHGTGLFDDEAAVPLAARLPGATPGKGRLGCTVGLVDILPTLCEYLALACPEAMFGRSFLTGVDERPVAEYLVTEGVMFKPRNRTIRNATYKLFFEPDGPHPRRGRFYGLYNVEQDPGEMRDLLSPENTTPKHKRIAEELAREMRESVPHFERPRAVFAPVDPELERRLRDLGYLE
jgi:arylsulfatase A-like enzyme